MTHLNGKLSLVVLARKARDDSPVWAEDWEDLSTSQDLITILKQQNH